MNLVALALKAYVPKWIKRQKLNSLFEATAMAFGVSVPNLDHFTFEQRLEQYAVFTRNEVEKRLQSGDDMREVRKALYLHAYNLGNELRKQLRLKSKTDVLFVGSALYRAIGIDFEGRSTGSVVIHSCYFSKFYSEAICRIMSSMDEGITAGLSGGCKLSFSQRITEGKPCCVAFLDFEGDAE
jgi:hypothetical protein